MTETDAAFKVRENRVRRALDRQGFKLLKSRARDPRDLTFGGYMVVDHQFGGAVAGGHGNAGRGYSMGLEDVERWVDNEPKPVGNVVPPARASESAR